jgi:hypothetical protein
MYKLTQKNRQDVHIGYILKFQRNSNNMKNEIGRKLTSLTIMAIMFAGGLTVAAPSFMPGVLADFSETDGKLSVSSVYIQGAAILEIVVNDPDFADVDNDVSNGPTVDIDGTEYNTNQASNGKWYVYAVDKSQSTLLDADGKGMEFGMLCTTGLGIETGPLLTVTERMVANVIPASINVWAEVASNTNKTEGGCLTANNMIKALDDTAGTTSRQTLSASVLTGAPSLSNHNGVAPNATTVDLGQRGHSLNQSGYGSWPYILAFEFSDDNLVEYGSAAINVEYGNTDDYTSLSVLNNSPSDETHIHVTITDPALNIDPTGVDKWRFNAASPDTSDHQLFFANNMTDTGSWNHGAITLAEMGDMGCVDNCALKNSTASGNSIISGLRDVVMVEDDDNSGIFESWADNGTSQLITVDEVAGDKVVILTYGGDSADIVITYNDATLEFTDDNGGNWIATESASVTLTDADANKKPGSTETLDVGDSVATIPTIKMGSPMTLANSDGNNALKAGSSASNTGVQIGTSCTTAACIGAGSSGHELIAYSLQVMNTTDNSERLRILLNDSNAEGSQSDKVGGLGHSHTWINVTTAHTVADLIALPGTVVLNYDISGPAESLSSTAIAVHVMGSGLNTTTSTDIGAVTAGNARTGVVDLDDGTDFIRSNDISEHMTAFADGNDDGAARGNNVGVAFKITHSIGTFLNASADFAIAADFCNFDQDNGSNVHNCIYRLEAEETGDNTGVFTGSVDYVVLNNSTSLDTDNGEHDGNDMEVEGLLTTNSDTLTVVVMTGVTGSDGIRVVYNDTDALQASDKLGMQIDTTTHSGTASLDADTYEADDMATITIVDADLNQDSEIRDTYQNSSRTFKITVTGSDGVAEQHVATNPITLIETSNDSGLFVGTFTVPDYKGEDMELTYFDSRDASGETVEVYDTTTVTSNSGTVSFDRSVYPVPFNVGDLQTGAAGSGLTDQAEAGNVTITIAVSDSDFTSDTLTTSGANAPGKILVKLIEGSTTTTCFTAGSAVAGPTAVSSTAHELGSLSETEIGSAVYELEFTVDEVERCGDNNRTISSGDVFQVEYVDTADDAGVTSTVYDSSTFDLRTGSLSIDKDVYVLGSDVVITLTDPDLNLDAGSIESYALSLIEWDSDADSSELMNDTDNFTANPSKLQETGEDTGVFQSVVTLPTASLYPGGDSSSTAATIDYGETVTLTYVDVGLSGEDSTEDDTLDVEAYFSISNFGALVELDKAVYNWTDTVYFTITSPDHNVNSASEETIGTTSLPIQVTTRVGKMCASEKTYKAAEDAPDSGVFTGEIALAGFDHTMTDSQAYDADVNTTGTTKVKCGSSDTDGIIQTAGQTDGVSVSYEYNDGSVVVASASISWNIGEASFDSSVASAGGSAVFTVVDPDENTDSTITDGFKVAIYSDSDAGGFKLTLNETDEDTGVFEGTVFFTADAATSGANIRVSEGDTVTAEYVDETLPEPYTSSDDLTIAGTLTIGTAFPPLERAPAANARVVDAFGSSVAEVSSGQQVQIAADVSNGQSKEQAFAYLVQVQDGNGVTVSLAWITGSLTAGQSMSPALSWTPDAPGSYTATVFVWESVDNPTALSPTVSVGIDVV